MNDTCDIKDRFAILVVSCDNYSDLWEPFFKLFWRFWPDCPFKVYLLSNNKKADIPGVDNLFVGDDVSWSDNLKIALKQIHEEYLLMFIDDLFLFDYVKSNKVNKVLEWMSKSCANYVRMNPTQKPDKPFNEVVGIVSKGTIYRASTVMSVWKKSILQELLKSGENAWEFEVYGTIRSDRYDGFYSTWEDFFPVVNGVIKGKWQRSAVRKLKSLGINIDLAKRDIMTFSETLMLYFKKLRSYILNFMPARYRRQIKDFFLLGKYDYKLK